MTQIPTDFDSAVRQWIHLERGWKAVLLGIVIATLITFLVP